MMNLIKSLKKWVGRKKIVLEDWRGKEREKEGVFVKSRVGVCGVGKKGERVLGVDLNFFIRRRFWKWSEWKNGG